MIDFHSHILPGIDDGSKSIKMSLDMLHDSFLQGVEIVVATPHLYLTDEKNIRSFIRKRDESFKVLKHAMAEDGRAFPEIKLGCELRILKPVSDVSLLRDLCIEGTNYILIEMPYKKWTMDYYDHFYALLLKGMRPIIAHIDRFMEHKKEFINLYSMDLIYQVNADAFIRYPVKYEIAKLFEHGAVHIIGSDMHDHQQRVSHMAKAKQAIIKGYGEDRWDYMHQNGINILNNDDILKINFAKKSFWETLKL